MNITIRELYSQADLDACVELQEIVWGRGFSERVPAALLRVSLRVGAVLAGAFDERGRLVGHVFGLTGVRDGMLIHWSDMMAVHPDARDRGIAERLKQFQRRLLLERNVRLAEWTFDPLEARNAWLNFARFGGIAREYIRDFYGSSDSPLHTGIATDRLIVTWEVESDRVANRMEGREPPPTADAFADAPFAFARNPAETGSPVTTGLTAPTVLVPIPPNIQDIKRTNPGLANAWRLLTRAAFEDLLPRGYVVTEFVRAPDGGAYVLQR